MNEVQKYIASLEELVDAQRNTIEKYHELEERNRKIEQEYVVLLDLHRELIRRLLDGRISEETKHEMLRKFQN